MDKILGDPHEAYSTNLPRLGQRPLQESINVNQNLATYEPFLKKKKGSRQETVKRKISIGHLLPGVQQQRPLETRLEEDGQLQFLSWKQKISYSFHSPSIKREKNKKNKQKNTERKQDLCARALAHHQFLFPLIICSFV